MNVNQYIPIAHLQDGHTYEQVFMVVEAYAVKRNKSFTKVVVQDVTGKMEGAIWDFDVTQNPGLVEPGEFIKMEVTIKNFRGNLQFNSNKDKIQPFGNAPDNITDYIQGPNENVLTVFGEDLQGIVDEIDDSHYRDIIGNAMNSLELISMLKTSPYGIEGPLAYRGGLLMHVTHSLKIALSAAEQCKLIEAPVNKSLIIVGCILRNIGWSTTTIFKGDYLQPRDAYYMTGIYRASSRFIDHLFLNTESAMQVSIPEESKQALENMCNPESNIKTFEGKIVAYADHMADLLHFGSFCLQRKSNQFNWHPDHNGFFTGHTRN
jgi:hypothetical protein